MVYKFEFLPSFLMAKTIFLTSSEQYITQLHFKLHLVWTFFSKYPLICPNSIEKLNKMLTKEMLTKSESLSRISSFKYFSESLVWTIENSLFAPTHIKSLLKVNLGQV